MGTSSWRRATARIRTHGKRALIMTNCRRSDRLPPSSARANPLARTTTIRSHRPPSTEARLSRKSGRIHAPRLTTCISAKVSPNRQVLSRRYRDRFLSVVLADPTRGSNISLLFETSTFFALLFLEQQLYLADDESPLKIPFIDDSSEYLRTISDRIYLEEAGYWGLVALRERENAEYADAGNANDAKYFG